MIQINKNIKNERLYLSFSGHAKYDVHGKDIVCAGISALYYTCLTGLKSFIDADLQIVGTEISVNNKCNEACKFIDLILSGVRNIERNYPDCVVLNEKMPSGVSEMTRGKDHAENIDIDSLSLFSEKDGAQSPEFTDGDHSPDASPAFKVFKTKEEYQQQIDDIIGRRLKKQREDAQRLEELDSNLKDACEYFGAQSSEEFFELLREAIDEDYDENEYEPDIDDYLDYDDPIESRPFENALSASAGVRTGKNLAYMDNDELEAIVRRVRNGEKIKF